MITNKTQHKQHFCIYDYYLDGVYLKWEEVEGECPILVQGQDWVVNLEDGTQITAKVIDIELVSENEHRIFLNSR
jgi:hypothetical protein